MCECVQYDIRDINRKGLHMDVITEALNEAKKAKAKSKPKAKKKPAAKKKAPAKRKPAPKKKKAVKKPAATNDTTRVDFRVPNKIKDKLYAKAKATRRTITSVVVELLEKMK